MPASPRPTFTKPEEIARLLKAAWAVGATPSRVACYTPFSKSQLRRRARKLGYRFTPGARSGM